MSIAMRQCAETARNAAHAARSRRVHSARREPQVDREQREPDRAERHEADLDLAARQPLAQQRSHADADREQRQQQREHVLVAAEHTLGERRKLGQVDRAVEPEPRDAEHRAPDDEVFLRDLQVAPRFGDGIPVDGKFRRDGRCQRDSPARKPAGNGHHDREYAREQRSIRLDRNDKPAGDRAEQDRDERAGFDEAVAADKLAHREVLRQDRVLDRPEQRRVQAEQRERREQQADARQDEPGQADHHDRDLEQLDPADHPRFLVFVGELARRRRERHERQDEDRADQVDDHAAVDRQILRGLERDEHDKRILEDVVVGRTEKLRPEERREAALAEQRELARDPGSVHRGKLSGAPGMVGR